MWTGAENLAPPGFDPRTVQPRSQSLYRLSYPGPLKYPVVGQNWAVLRCAAYNIPLPNQVIVFLFVCLGPKTTADRQSWLVERSRQASGPAARLL